jgi:hypothetical protein
MSQWENTFPGIKYPSIAAWKNTVPQYLTIFLSPLKKYPVMLEILKFA